MKLRLLCPYDHPFHPVERGDSQRELHGAVGAGDFVGSRGWHVTRVIGFGGRHDAVVISHYYYDNGPIMRHDAAAAAPWPDLSRVTDISSR